MDSAQEDWFHAWLGPLFLIPLPEGHVLPFSVIVF